jgi:hypothetical protein
LGRVAHGILQKRHKLAWLGAVSRRFAEIDANTITSIVPINDWDTGCRWTVSTQEVYLKRQEQLSAKTVEAQEGIIRLTSPMIIYPLYEDSQSKII